MDDRLGFVRSAVNNLGRLGEALGKGCLLRPGRNEDSGDGLCVVNILAEAGSIRNRLLHGRSRMSIYKEMVIMFVTILLDKKMQRDQM